MSWQEMQHNQRVAMIDELHSRPFLKINAPAQLAFLALKPQTDGLHTARTARRQLLAFLDLFDAPHPEEDAVYYFVSLDGMTLKWENHSEFATYTLFVEGESREPFASDLHKAFDADWLSAHDAHVISSVTIEIEPVADRTTMETRLNGPLRAVFSRPTFPASIVTDEGAAIAADFDRDANGHLRFVILAHDRLGPGRIGRVAQRLLEIETYRAMSMLALPVARKLLGELGVIETRLSDTVSAMATKHEEPARSLEDLLKISADLAYLSSQSSFRFSASRAYETLVHQRIELLREERLLERQTFAEFMKRRYDPTMRTCLSAASQLEDLQARAAQASELLGTHVSVTTSAQNRELLAKMDRRAAQQARLQETVEGISVVAISYYAVSLLSYLLAPVAKLADLSKTTLAALLVLPVVALVWWSMHRLKERLIRKPDGDDAEG